MSISLCGHAKQRMQQRGIEGYPEGLILQFAAISKPKSRYCVIKDRVIYVCKKTQRDVLIITAWRRDKRKSKGRRA